MSSQRPFDLKKLDFEAIRLARRRKLLLYSLPVASIAIVICLKMLSVPVLSSIAHLSYEKSQYKSSGQLLYPLYVANWLESYKLPFNHGNSLFKQGDYQAAEGRYREALKSVPKEQECSVRINLSLSLAAQADTLMSDKAYDNAIVLYDDMKAVLYDGEDSCGVQFNNTSIDSEENTAEDEEPDSENSNSSDKSQQVDEDDSSSGDSKDSDADRAKKIMNRAQEKSSAAKRQRNGDEASSNDANDDSQSDSESTKEKLEKLEEKSQNAQRKRVEQSDRSQRQSTDYGKNDRSYKSKNW